MHTSDKLDTEHIKGHIPDGAIDPYDRLDMEQIGQDYSWTTQTIGQEAQMLSRTWNDYSMRQIRHGTNRTWDNEHRPCYGDHRGQVGHGTIITIWFMGRIQPSGCNWILIKIFLQIHCCSVFFCAFVCA